MLTARTGPVWALLAGCLAAFLLLECGLFAGGRLVLLLRDRGNRPGRAGADETRIVCLGDSITVNSYPPRLAAALEKRAPGGRFRVFDLAMPSTDSNYVVNAMDGACRQFRPAMVLVMTGVNDRRDPVLFRDYFGPGAFYQKMRVYRFGRFVLPLLFPRQGGEGKKLENQVWSPASWRAELERVIRAEPGQTVKKFDALLQWHALRGDGPGLLAAYGEASAAFPENFRLADWYLPLIIRGLAPAGRLDEADALLARVVEADPGDCLAANLWLKLLAQRGEDARARELTGRMLARGTPLLFARADLECLLHDEPSYDDAVYTLDDLGDFGGSDRVVRAALKTFPGSSFLWHAALRTLLVRGDLAALRERLREPEVAAVFGPAWRDGALAACGAAPSQAARAGAFAALDCVGGQTALNLQTLARKALVADVRLACLSYPMCSATGLKRALGDFGETVVFVDDGAAFRKAVAAGGYARYFRDVYGGNFGHLTGEGAQLLADTVADALAGCLGKRGGGAAA